MNDLEKKIWALISHHDYIFDEAQVKNLSQFFLEEIKQAFDAGADHEYSSHFGTISSERDARIENYLKSKYNIQ